MSTCEGCAVKGHDPGACANRDLPLCARVCTCRHGAPESDPAPYWTAVNKAALEGAGLDLAVLPSAEVAR